MDFKEKFRKLDLVDFALIKITIFFFGLAVGSYLSSSLTGNEIWLVVIAILASIKPCYVAYLKK